MNKFLIISLIILPLNYTSAVTYIVPYVGFETKDNNPIIGGIEARFQDVHRYIVPKIGGSINSDGSTYFYAGLNLDLDLYKKKLYLTVGTSVGYYSKHKGKDLGGPIEFRSGLEFNYKMENQNKIGIAITHISNAGIYKRNPGAEAIMLSYGIPI